MQRGRGVDAGDGGATARQAVVGVTTSRPYRPPQSPRPPHLRLLHMPND